MQIGNITFQTVDLVAIAILIFFLVRGMLKGFVTQLAGVVTFAGGLLIAKQVAPKIQPTVASWLGDKVTPTNHLDLYVSYFVIFIAFMVIVAIIARLLRSAISSLKLGSYDRLLGAVLGLALGAFFIIVAVLGSSHFLPDQADRTLSGTYTAVYTQRAVDVLTPLFPEKIQEKVARYTRPKGSEEPARAKDTPPSRSGDTYKAPGKK
ncbi:MAG: CvpA family protein [Planctomycetota bacterium]